MAAVFCFLAPAIMAAESEVDTSVPSAELISRLGNDQFKVREQAESELHRRLHLTPGGEANPIEQLCLKVFLETDDPEIRSRAASVLEDYATRLWSPVGYLGIAMNPDSGFDEFGKPFTRLRVDKVQEGSPAAKSGIKIGDFILGFNDKAFEGGNPKGLLTHHLGSCPPGQIVKLSILRDGRPDSVQVILGFKARKPQQDKEGREIPLDPKTCLKEYLPTVVNRSSPQPSKTNPAP